MKDKVKVRTKPVGKLRVGERIEVFVVVNGKPFYRWEPLLEKETVGKDRDHIRLRTANAKIDHLPTKLLRFMPGEGNDQ